MIAFFKQLYFNKVALFAAIMFTLFFITAICAECYSFYCENNNIPVVYDQGNINNKYKPPSLKNICGTDYQGRDIFWRGVFGIRTAFKIGIIASVLSITIGVVLGTLAGYFGNWVDDIITWIYSTFAAMPTLLFILAFALLVTKGFLFAPIANILDFLVNTFNMDIGIIAVYLGIGLTGWVGLCRIVRAETMKLREANFVLAAKCAGCSSFRIIIKQIIPNLSHIIIIFFTMRFAYAIMTEVIISYLGIGVQMEPSWGVMISDGQARLWRGIWWELATATTLLFFLTLSLHLLGDFLRDHLSKN